MPSKNSSKKEEAGNIGVSVFPISVIGSSRLKPYVESFFHSPSNLVQQPLGNLFGFFKIRDMSDDSAYIVNFISSVVKKEYYLNPRRSVEDSFDAALHKVNIALSELAKNGNINWFGTLDGAVCVIEKNNFYFSVAGNARILLLRNGILSDISEGLALAEEGPHPIKTFVNVSSGQLKAGDKIIAASDDIFKVFSLAEIKKNALRFPREKFSQFMHTALVNELDAAETIIIDVFEEEKIRIKKEKPKEEDLSNFFSAEAFKKSDKAGSEIFANENIKREAAEFTDEKTGHIYVQEEQKADYRKSRWSNYWLVIREKLGDLSYWIMNLIKSMFFGIKKNLKKISWKDTAISEKLKIYKINFKISAPQINFSRVSHGIKDVFKKIAATFPSFTKARETFSRLSIKQRLYGILIIAVIVFAPLIFNKIKNKGPAAPLSPEEQKARTLKEVLSQDKNINLSTSAQIIFSEAKTIGAEIVSDNLLIAGPQKIIRKENSGNTREFPLPRDSGNIILTAPMKDLNLLFLLTDKSKVFSFSPISREFKENNIRLPQNAKVKSMAAYLTYLYLVDGETNKIYRYPRAEGGFGPGASWLKEDANLSSVKSMAIDENIYLATDGGIAKFFKGKKQEFGLEQSNTPFKIDKVFTNSDTPSLYALDSSMGRFIKFSKNGEIISQYYNEFLENSKDFAVDEKNNKAFIVTSENQLAEISL